MLDQSRARIFDFEQVQKVNACRFASFQVEVLVFNQVQTG
jgi:hypothetical protein